MKQRFVVVPKVPNAGLGNMLLVWARAVMFAELNNLPVQTPNWKTFHIGPWLRREKCKRYYGNFFHSRYYQSRLQTLTQRRFHTKICHLNPAVKSLNLQSNEFQTLGQHQFIFDQMPPWNDYFQDLKHHQPWMRQRLLDEIRPSILRQIMLRPSPAISIHVRLGDYAQPQGNEDFSVQRIVSTSIDWYVETLLAVRQQIGQEIPVTVFSDGRMDELKALLNLPNITLAPEASALSDLITMSRSQLLLASCHSSFSAWASYLGQCPTLWDANRIYLYKPIFNDEVGNRVYNGGFDLKNKAIPPLLVDNLRYAFMQNCAVV